ncbi:T9SS type A sorting domain-containing protein [Cyclobacterium salsum]|uniref:T9SS type A sorting domain-containing protein n=1 Tax=Cyclobacterium salsum TaxID=2666329 RepID=UPI001390ACAB|nr:T9SS type A sorting domain-containing protein [Cyclobacterium salsum]
MKTLATLVLTLSLALGGMAADKSLMEISSIEAKEQRFTLRLTEAAGQVMVSIYNPDGKLIDRNHYKVNSPLNIPYNLSKMPEGNYKVKLETKEEIVSFKMENRKKVEKKLLAYTEIIDPKTFTLKVLGIEKPGTEVTIFDNSHTKIATDVIQETGGFAKNYHLKFLKVEEVYLQVKDAEGRIKYLYLD